MRRVNIDILGVKESVATYFWVPFHFFTVFIFFVSTVDSLKKNIITENNWSRSHTIWINSLRLVRLIVFSAVLLKKKKKKKKRLVWFGSPTFSTSSAPVWYGSKSTDSYCSCFTRITQAYSSQVRASDDTLYNKIKWQAAFGMVDPDETWPLSMQETTVHIWLSHPFNMLNIWSGVLTTYQNYL